MNLFNNYCYPDLDSAATAELTLPYQVNSTGVISGKSYSITSDTTVDMAFHYSPLTGSPYDVVHSRNYPACTQVGYLTNVTGLTLSDVTEISFGVILVWVTAFSFRAMGRPMGGR